MSQTATAGSGEAGGPKYLLDHDYHEISDEEGAVESPRFEVSLLEFFKIAGKCQCVLLSFWGVDQELVM